MLVKVSEEMLLAKVPASLERVSHLALMDLKERVIIYRKGSDERMTRVSLQSKNKLHVIEMDNIRMATKTFPAKRPSMFRISSGFRSRISVNCVSPLWSCSNQACG